MSSILFVPENASDREREIPYPYYLSLYVVHSGWIGKAKILGTRNQALSIFDTLQLRNDQSLCSGKTAFISPGVLLYISIWEPKICVKRLFTERWRYLFLLLRRALKLSQYTDVDSSTITPLL